MGDNLESSGDEGVCKCNTLRFRCLFFTRAAVALVVTVLAVIVVFKAVDLILHPNKLQLTVSPSDVYVHKLEPPVEASDGSIYEYIFRFYLEAKNPSERDFIYYSNITVLLKQGDMLIANFNLTSPSSIPLSQQEEQEYFVYGYTDHQQVNTSLFASTIFKDEDDTEAQKIDGAVMTLDGIIRENQEGSTNTYRRHATYDCESVGVGRTLPRPSSSDSHKGKCGRSIL